MFKENRIVFSRLGSVGSGRTGAGGSGGGVNRSGQRNSSYDSSGGALAGQDPGMLSAVANSFTTPEARDAAINELKQRGLWQEPTAEDIANLTNSYSASGDNTDLVAGEKAALDYINKLVKDGTITQDEADIYGRIVELYGLDEDVNIQNVLKKFKEAKDETIDPYYKQRIDTFERELKTNLEAGAQSRALELEAEGYSAEEAMRTARASLEASGMTFSGKAVKDLGGGSAFAEEDKPNAFIKQRQFGGGYAEGNVPMKNRLISTSSSQRYQNALKQSGLSAEKYLGSDRLGGYDFGEYSQVRGVTGTLDEAKESTMWNIGGQILGNEYARVGYTDPIAENVKFNT